MNHTIRDLARRLVEMANAPLESGVAITDEQDDLLREAAKRFRLLPTRDEIARVVHEAMWGRSNYDTDSVWAPITRMVADAVMALIDGTVDKRPNDRCSYMPIAVGGRVCGVPRHCHCLTTHEFQERYTYEEATT